MPRLRTLVSAGGISVLLALVAWGCSGAGDADQPAAQSVASDFQVASPNFSQIRPRKRIPNDNTCHGANLSPPPNWSGAPEGTKSLALIRRRFRP